MTENPNPIKLLFNYPKKDSSLTKNIEEHITKIVQDLALGKYSENEAIDTLNDYKVEIAKGTDIVKKHYNGNAFEYLNRFLIGKYQLIYEYLNNVISNRSRHPDKKKPIILYN